MNSPTLTTAAAKTRGERLYPARTSRVHWILTAIRVEMETIIRQFLPRPSDQTGRLFDFGCGNMPYRALFEPHIGEYVGCDLPGNEQADCTLEQPDRLPYPDASAAIVLSSSVLEHVVNPATYLAECNRVLADEGLLILSTHGIWRYHPDPLDLWRWTSEGLRRVVEGAGFSVLHFAGVLGPAATGLQLWQDATLPRVPTFLRPLITWFIQGRIRSADRKCPPRSRDADASVYVVVAKCRSRQKSVPAETVST